MSSTYIEANELISLLNTATEIDSFNEYFKIIQDNLSGGKNVNLLNAIIESYLNYQSNDLLKLLMFVQDPYHKLLFDKLHEFQKSSSKKSCHRLTVLTLFAYIIKRQHMWLHSIVGSKFFITFLTDLKTETDPVCIVSGVLCIASILPQVPVAMSNYLCDIFAIFDHVAVFFMSPPIDRVADIYLLHIHVALYSLFHRLYGMFPNHFLEHMRVMCRFSTNQGGLRGDTRRRRDIAAAFDHVVRDWLKGVRLHPMLVTSGLDHERSRQRWQRKESHDILVDCSRYALDMIESTTADCGYVVGLADVPAELSSNSSQEVAYVLRSHSNNCFSAASIQQVSNTSTSLSYAQYLSGIQSHWCTSATQSLIPLNLSTDGILLKSSTSVEPVELNRCKQSSFSDVNQLADKLLTSNAESSSASDNQPPSVQSEPSQATCDSVDVDAMLEVECGVGADDLKDLLPMGDDPSDDEGVAVSRPPLVHGLVRRIRLNTVGPVGSGLHTAMETIVVRHKHSRSFSCPAESCGSKSACDSVVAAAVTPTLTSTQKCRPLRQSVTFDNSCLTQTEEMVACEGGAGTDKLSNNCVKEDGGSKDWRTRAVLLHKKSSTYEQLFSLSLPFAPFLVCSRCASCADEVEEDVNYAPFSNDADTLKEATAARASDTTLPHHLRSFLPTYLSVAPSDLLDIGMLNASYAHSLLPSQVPQQFSPEWAEAALPPERAATLLRTRLILSHAQLLFERHRRQQHGQRNRRLLGRLVRLRTLEADVQTLRAQTRIADEELHQNKELHARQMQQLSSEYHDVLKKLEKAEESLSLSKKSVAEQKELLQQSLDKNAHLEKELVNTIRDNQRLRWRVQQFELEVKAAEAEANQSSALLEALRHTKQRLFVMTEAQLSTQRRLVDAENELTRLTSWQRHEHTSNSTQQEALNARCHFAPANTNSTQREQTITQANREATNERCHFTISSTPLEQTNTQANHEALQARCHCTAVNTTSSTQREQTSTQVNDEVLQARCQFTTSSTQHEQLIQANHEALQARCHLLAEIATKAQNEAAVARRKAQDMQNEWRVRVAAAESRSDAAELCVHALEHRILELEMLLLRSQERYDDEKVQPCTRYYSMLECPTDGQLSVLLTSDI